MAVESASKEPISLSFCGECVDKLLAVDIASISLQSHDVDGGCGKDDLAQVIEACKERHDAAKRVVFSLVDGRNQGWTDQLVDCCGVGVYQYRPTNSQVSATHSG